MDDDTPLDETLFLIIFNLCKIFPSLDPFEIEDRPFGRVIELYSDTIKAKKRENAEANPNRVIRKKAGDDWF